MCDGKDGTCDRTAHTGCLNKEFPARKATGSARNVEPRRRSRRRRPSRSPRRNGSRLRRKLLIYNGWVPSPACGLMIL